LASVSNLDKKLQKAVKIARGQICMTIANVHQSILAERNALAKLSNDVSPQNLMCLEEDFTLPGYYRELSEEDLQGEDASLKYIIAPLLKKQE
jgi:hypothetical protein